jgi:isoamylase
LGVEDIAWFLPDGTEMTDEHWSHDFAKSLGVYMNGHGLRSVGPKGEQMIDDDFYVIFNAHHEPMKFKLPSEKYGTEWSKVIDTTTGQVGENGKVYKAGKLLEVGARSIVLLHSETEKKPKVAAMAHKAGDPI